MNSRFFFALFLGAMFAPMTEAKGPVEVKGREAAILERFVKELVPLQPGKEPFPKSFTMGSPSDAPKTEQPQVKITFTEPFAISRYEVTQELYLVVMGNNPSKWLGPRNSVEMTTWADANTFCKKLTTELRKRKLIGADELIRLPSEAEWEYACRAGTSTRYSFGDDVEDLGPYAWHNGNSKGYDPPVGKKKPNPWKLYDMHGYINEWCADAWHPSHKGADASGKARVDAKNHQRVIRGGSWADPADQHRSAFRAGKPIDFKSDALGFRCVKVRGS